MYFTCFITVIVQCSFGICNEFVNGNMGTIVCFTVFDVMLHLVLVGLIMLT